MTEGGLTIGVVNPEAVVIADEDDGGVVIDFNPGGDEQQIAFDANLAEHMEDGDLSSLASDLMASYDEDRASRSDWEEAYICLLYTSPSPRD